MSLALGWGIRARKVGRGEKRRLSWTADYLVGARTSSDPKDQAVNLIIDLLKGFVAAHEVAQATVGVYQWICDRISNWSLKAPAEAVQEQVEKMAKIPEAEIRELAEEIL